MHDRRQPKAALLKKHRMPTRAWLARGRSAETLRKFCKVSAFAADGSRSDARDLGPQQGIVGGSPPDQTVAVRSMPQAVYQPENIGHFGLVAQYAHFTSPCRYPTSRHRGSTHPARRHPDDFPWSPGRWRARPAVLVQGAAPTEEVTRVLRG
jgi:ribonuclease R